MKVVIFFSGGASSLKAMLDDTSHGKLYKVVGAYTDKEDAKGRQLCQDNGIPHLFISRKDFYSKKGLDPKNQDSRKRFYEMLTKEIEKFGPDIICLSGYMHIVSDPLLTEYINRILNVHPADLTILSGPGVAKLDASQILPEEARKLIDANNLQRKIKGENAVYDAIMMGEKELRSTVHLAWEDFDEGPIITQSKPFDVDDAIRELASLGQGEQIKQYAKEMQEKMKLEGDGPAYLKALYMIAMGDMAIKGESLYRFGEPLPYCGFRLK